MQDRFKFRAWDRKENQLKNIFGYTFSLGFNDLVHIHWTNGTYEPSRRFKDLIFMQCTGLKDKNGELVYFDDFVKLDDGIICIVKQIEDINDIEYGRVVAIPVFCLNQKYQTRYIPTVIAESEKVGNLYENPELLERN